MSDTIFEGKSTNGNIEEAIEIAVELAKESLQTDFVIWKLLDVQGKYGGAVLQRHLTVRVSASGPSPG